jgi:hypothetical protein
MKQESQSAPYVSRGCKMRGAEVCVETYLVFFAPDIESATCNMKGGVVTCMQYSSLVWCKISHHCYAWTRVGPCWTHPIDFQNKEEACPQ